MTHDIYEHRAVTWRHQNLPGLFPHEFDKTKTIMRGQETCLGGIFVKERTTAYSDRKRSISVLQSAISCDMDLYARVKPRRPCIFINLRDVSWRRLNALCHRISKHETRARKHTVPRPFSVRLPRDPEAGVRAIKTLTVDEAARPGHRERPCCAWLSATTSIRRKRRLLQNKVAYVDHLDDVEQTVDRSFQRGSCYWDHPRDSLDQRRDELDDLGSFGKKSRFW